MASGRDSTPPVCKDCAKLVLPSWARPSRRNSPRPNLEVRVIPRTRHARQAAAAADRRLRHAVRRPRHTGGRLHPATLGLLRSIWVQAFGRRDQPRRQPGLPQPERHRRDCREPCRCLGDGPRRRRSGGRRSGLSRPDGSAHRSATAASDPARSAAHRRMVDPGGARTRFAGGGVGPAARRQRDGATPDECPALATAEAATTETQQITMGINAWEWRCRSAASWRVMLRR
jgi:hypothetical protein